MTESALRLEAKKDGFAQLQSGSYKLTLTLNPTDFDDNAQALLLDFIKAPMGQRYMIGMAEIGDDEQPVAAQPKPEKPKRKWSKIPRSEQAGIKCQDRFFQDWMYSQYAQDNAFHNIADAVRDSCGVKSRAEFDTDEDAGQRWDRLLAQYERDTGRVAEARG